MPYISAGGPAQNGFLWLTDWVTTPASKAFGARLFCFVAIGGMGKSELTWQWFQQIAPQEMRPLAGRLWWSFYESVRLRISASEPCVM